MTAIIKPADGDPNWGAVVNTALDDLNAGKAELGGSAIQSFSVAAPSAPTHAVPKSQLDIAMPVGAILDFSRTTAPTGWLACPTSATNISRTTYAALFEAIGTTWGVGDGSTTFGMPWFPADYASVQANANVGTRSVGENLAHTHTYTMKSITGGSATGGDPLNLGTATYNTGSTGGTANLAAGVRVLKCVKY